MHDVPPRHLQRLRYFRPSAGEVAQDLERAVAAGLNRHPGTAQRPEDTELPLPAGRLRVRERERVAELTVEVQRVRAERGGEEEQRDEPPDLPPVPRPQEVDQCGQKREPQRPGCNREGSRDACEPGPSALRGEERPCREEQEQPFGVHSREDECRREQRENQDGVARAALSEPLARDLRNAPRAETRCDQGEQRSPHHGRAEQRQNPRVEREERCRDLVVPVAGDLQEPVGIPLREGPEDEIRDGIPRPLRGRRVGGGRRPEQRRGRAEPERDADPDERPERAPAQCPSPSSSPSSAARTSGPTVSRT